MNPVRLRPARSSFSGAAPLRIPTLCSCVRCRFSSGFGGWILLLLGAGGLVLEFAGCGDEQAPEELVEASDQRRFEAGARLAEELEEEPNQPDDWFEWGVLSLELGFPVIALERFERAEKLRDDPRFLEFVGHAQLARGDFGGAYQSYRRAAARGWIVEPALAAARSRVGDIVRHDTQLPGLAAVIEATVPAWRSRIVSELARLEARGDERPIELREVDRVLLDYVARTAPAERTSRPHDVISSYWIETGRGVAVEPDAIRDPRRRAEVVRAIRDIAGEILSGGETTWSDDRNTLVWSAKGATVRGKAEMAEDFASLASELLGKITPRVQVVSRQRADGSVAFLLLRDEQVEYLADFDSRPRRR